MVQLFRPSTSRPVFRVRAALLRLDPRLLSFHSVTTPPEQRYIVPNFQTANGLSQSVAPERRLAPTIPLRGSFWALPVTDPQPEIPDQDDGSGPLMMTAHQVVQLGNRSWPKLRKDHTLCQN